MADLEKLQSLMSEYLRNGVDPRQLYQYYSQHVMYQHLQMQRHSELHEELKNLRMPDLRSVVQPAPLSPGSPQVDPRDRCVSPPSQKDTSTADVPSQDCETVHAEIQEARENIVDYDIK
jgi:hypothetical protein